MALNSMHNLRKKPYSFARTGIFSHRATLDHLDLMEKGIPHPYRRNGPQFHIARNALKNILWPINTTSYGTIITGLGTLLTRVVSLLKLPYLSRKLLVTGKSSPPRELC
ncbi:hypothetical protein GDO78_014277 [Eleutherodactylus coqui]|uniref:Uncharacterized protein n=1 Tax=Eleutherodactylus coqui TaxID=57060 RepID=A0A8J6B389_ELECQ|nr:hypothetical protein GDO78_014277 [Eleutherodactylus coqui]